MKSFKKSIFASTKRCFFMCDRWQIGKNGRNVVILNLISKNLHSLLLSIEHFYFKKLFSEIKLKKWY